MLKDLESVQPYFVVGDHSSQNHYDGEHSEKNIQRAAVLKKSDNLDQEDGIRSLATDYSPWDYGIEYEPADSDYISEDKPK